MIIPYIPETNHVSIDNTVLQLYCSYFSWCIERYLQCLLFFFVLFYATSVKSLKFLCKTECVQVACVECKFRLS